MARVTLADVARRAGVSPASVSAAFNDPAQLSDATVARILTTARRLGYAANPHARALHSRRVGVLGLLFPQAIESASPTPSSRRSSRASAPSPTSAASVS